MQVIAALVAGAVALRGKSSRVVVLAIAGERALVAPVEQLAPEGGRMRGDVAVTWDQLGVPGSGRDGLAVRGGHASVVDRRTLTAISRIPGKLLAEIEDEVMRARRTALIERSPRVPGSMLEAACISHGRRRGAAGLG